MQTLHLNEKIKYFIISFLCLFCITGFWVTYLFAKEAAKEEQHYIETITNEAQNTLYFFSQSLISSVNSCNSIFATRWYTRYRNIANIYVDYFDPMRRMEIQTDLAAKVTSLTYVSDILIITPPLDTVICKNGWFSTDFYHRVHGNISISFSDDRTAVSEVRSKDNAHVILTLTDPTTRREKGIICILIDKNAIASVMGQISNPQIVYYHLSLSDQTLYESGSFNDDLLMVESSINMPTFSIQLGALPYRTSLLNDRIHNYTLAIIIVILVSLLLSYIVTGLFFRPIKKLVNLLGGDFQAIADPYHFITDSVDANVRKYELLNDEQSRMNQSIRHFVVMMRNEMLNGMLTNPDFDFAHDYIREAFPWFENELPFVMVLLTPFSETSIESPQIDRMENPQLSPAHKLQFTVLPGDRCLLYWFKTSRIATIQRRLLVTQLQQNAGNNFCFDVSGILVKPEQLHQQYITMKTDIALRKQIENGLPISSQIQLVNKLQANKLSECLVMLHDLQESMDPTIVMSFLYRIAADYDIEPDQIKEQYNQFLKCQDSEARWSCIRIYTQQLCTLIDTIRHESVYNIGKLIRSYIDENYRDPDLCMKQLADKFSMHRTQISKVFKAQLGVTFSEYLQELRIKKALEMIQSVDMPLSEIAKTVGYINYITFKNAFVRVKGMTPRDYRSQ